jgi:AcrR family transcriptional regulator|nr:TetR family transcriptional regulator [Aeromicrobium sp.]
MGKDEGRTRDPERKSRILTAAGDLIGRSGFHSVSMSEIGADAGITGSGIYRHFESKSSILVSLFDDIIDGLIARQTAILDSQEQEQVLLEHLVTDQVLFVVGKRELAQVYFNEIQNLPEQDRARLRRKQRLYVEEWVHLLQETRPAVDDAQARVLVHAAIGAIQSSLFHNVGLDADRLSQLLEFAAHAVLNLDLVD